MDRGGGSRWPSLSSSVPLVKGGDWASSLGISEFGNFTALGGKEVTMGMTSLCRAQRPTTTASVSGIGHRLLRAPEVYPPMPHGGANMAARAE